MATKTKNKKKRWQRIAMIHAQPLWHIKIDTGFESHKINLVLRMMLKPSSTFGFVRLAGCKLMSIHCLKYYSALIALPDIFVRKRYPVCHLLCFALIWFQFVVFVLCSICCFCNQNKRPFYVERLMVWFSQTLHSMSVWYCIAISIFCRCFFFVSLCLNSFVECINRNKK